eukprot:CCRYP_015710-RD/>CCRYP_015710-RD protein AED:0.10 eAED:0.10 QI:1189/0.66/0.75/1/0.66/0.5/4/0/762
MDSILPAFLFCTTANALFAAGMSSMSRPSPRRKLTEIRGSNANSLRTPSNGTEKQPSSTCSPLWKSPPRNNVASPPRRRDAAKTIFDASPVNSKGTPRRTARVQSSKKKSSSFAPAFPTSPPEPPRGGKLPPLLRTSTSPRFIRLDPRISNGCQSKSVSSHAADSDCTHMDDSKRVVSYPKACGQTTGSASSNDSISFTLTPTVMFSDEVHHQQIQRENKRRDQQFHHSPHWTGKVRINPFSPVPERYLQPPSSTKSLPSLKSSHGLPILTGGSLSPLSPSTRLSQPLEKRRSRRLKPKTVTFPSTVLEERVSPTDVTEDPFGIDCHEEQLHLDTSPRKRTSSEMLRLPQSMVATDNNWDRPRKQLKTSRSRYLEDFEEVSHLGSGSFGSVNACLSRLDGCMYAIKTISPHGIQKSSVGGYNSTKSQSKNLYGGKQSYTLDIPPTPRRDLMPSPMKRRRQKMNSSLDGSEDTGGGGSAIGTKHWTEPALKRMLREVHALAALCSQADVRTFHIVRYHQAWFEDDGTLYIQTELCSNTLRDEMQTINGESKVPKYSPSTATHSRVINGPQHFKCLREILLALQLVHSKGMVHLDIKPENIFVHNGLYKLGDFGLVGIATATDVEEGDSRYMSREMLEDGQRDLTKCDIFSLGATMYELCTGRPLPSCGAEWHDIRNGNLTPFWPPSLFNTIREMMNPDPMRRPSASELLSRDELSCRSGEWLMNNAANGKKTSVDSVYNLCMKETVPSLKRSSSWILTACSEK